MKKKDFMTFEPGLERRPSHRFGLMLICKLAAIQVSNEILRAIYTFGWHNLYTMRVLPFIPEFKIFHL
jgi:hypothetical protein